MFYLVKTDFSKVITAYIWWQTIALFPRICRKMAKYSAYVAAAALFLGRANRTTLDEIYDVLVNCIYRSYDDRN